MTEEDRLLIEEYLYRNPAVARMRREYKNLNDAGLCVKEMQKRKDWDGFMGSALLVCFKITKIDIWPTNFYAWLYDRDNFFTVFSAWLKEGKK